MKKTLPYTCFFFLVLLLCSCGSSSEPQEQIGYNDLTVEQTNVVDIVYDALDEWDSIYDSGKMFSCSNVAFFHNGSDLLFLPTYNKKEGTAQANDIDSQTGLVQVYYVNIGNSCLEGYSFPIGSQIKGAVHIAAFGGPSIDIKADESTVKDTLAYAYAQ